jgi:hypothetical protein
MTPIMDGFRNRLYQTDPIEKGQQRKCIFFIFFFFFSLHAKRYTKAGMKKARPSLAGRTWRLRLSVLLVLRNLVLHIWPLLVHLMYRRDTFIGYFDESGLY